MDIKELDEALATASIVNKHFPPKEPVSNGSAENVIINDINSINRQLDLLTVKHSEILEKHKAHIDDLIISNAQLIANQKVLMDWVKANTHADKEKLRSELLENDQEFPDDNMDMRHKREIMGELDKKLFPEFHKNREQQEKTIIEQSPLKEFYSTLTFPRKKKFDSTSRSRKTRQKHKKALKWLLEMFKIENPIHAQLLHSMANDEGIVRGHLVYIKETYVGKNGLPLIKTTLNGKKAKWYWHLREDI